MVKLPRNLRKPPRLDDETTASDAIVGLATGLVSMGIMFVIGEEDLRFMVMIGLAITVMTVYDRKRRRRKKRDGESERVICPSMRSAQLLAG